jgi:hypothetical protein
MGTYVLRKGVARLSDLAGGVPEALLMGDGKVFYVDPGNGNDSNEGDTPERAFASTQQAIDQCVAGRGDLILRLPGGEEVTSTVNFNKNGIYVKVVTYGANSQAMGELASIYAAASFTDGPVATITARCTIEGMGFVSRDADSDFYNGAAMLIGGQADATPFGVHILRCRFPKWNLDNSLGIAIEGSSDTVIEECAFEGVGSDFDAGIYVQGATQNLTIIGNRFRDCTYAVEFGDFAGGGPHCMIGSNICEDAKLLSAGSAATGIVFDNWLETATDSGSYSTTVDTLNGYGLQISDNHYAE